MAASEVQRPTTPSGIQRRRLSARHLVSVGAALLVFGGFFLPWMDGSGPFGLRTFSGFDFARLVRNFEITADSASATAQVRVSAIAMYIIPAAAVNAAVLHVLSALAELRGRAIGSAMAAGGLYVVGMLTLVLFLSLVPLNDFESAVGPPSWGFGVTLGGGLLLAWTGRGELRRATNRFRRDSGPTHEGQA